jgi:DNA-binding winged helix-turn-helix (wHTH) protein
MSAARELNMQDGRNRVLEFDRFVVDLDAALLRSGGRVIETEPQVFELIAFLCTNPGRLIGYDEIIAKVWHGRIVSDAAIATRINAARKALGDDGTAQRVIKTVRGRGLRFQLEPVSRSIEAKAQPSVPDCRHDLGPQTNLDGPSIKNISLTALSRTSLPDCPALRSSSSSPATRRLPTRADPSTSAKSGASWGCATCWKGACERPATGYA